MEYSIPFVCLFGILTVFCSLVIIVLLSSAMSAVIRAIKGRRTAAPKVSFNTPKLPITPPAGRAAADGASAVSPELIAAVTAAIAEDLGVDFSNVRITSVRQA